MVASTTATSREVGKQKKKCIGSGLVNGIINRLPFQLHVPGGCSRVTNAADRIATPDEFASRVNRVARTVLGSDSG